MKIPAILVLTAIVAGCASRYVDPLNLPLVDKPEDVARSEGKEVRLVGEVSNTKIPQILGVDVESDDPDLRGKQAEAYGILKRYVVTDAQIRAFDRDGIAHRGAGIFWVLQDPKTKARAKAGAPLVVCIFTIPGPGEKKPNEASEPTAPSGRGSLKTSGENR
jgi:hypothetical protein